MTTAEITTFPLAMLSDQVVADWLRDRGWHVTRAEQFGWETPSAFSVRHGFGPNWFAIVRCRGVEPPAFERQKGRTGRVIFMRSNPELEAWAKARKPNQ